MVLKGRTAAATHGAPSGHSGVVNERTHVVFWESLLPCLIGCYGWGRTQTESVWRTAAAAKGGLAFCLVVVQI